MQRQRAHWHAHRRPARSQGAAQPDDHAALHACTTSQVCSHSAAAPPPNSSPPPLSRWAQTISAAHMCRGASAGPSKASSPSPPPLASRGPRAPSRRQARPGAVCSLAARGCSVGAAEQREVLPHPGRATRRCMACGTPGRGAHLPCPHKGERGGWVWGAGGRDRGEEVIPRRAREGSTSTRRRRHSVQCCASCCWWARRGRAEDAQRTPGRYEASHITEFVNE